MIFVQKNDFGYAYLSCSNEGKNLLGEIFLHHLFMEFVVMLNMNPMLGTFN